MEQIKIQRFKKISTVSSDRKLVRALVHKLWFGPVPTILKKLLKIPISALKRLMIRVIIYLDDLLILGKSMSELFMARDSAIFLLQHLGFVINLKKCVLDSVQET